MTNHIAWVPLRGLRTSLDGVEKNPKRWSKKHVQRGAKGVCSVRIPRIVDTVVIAIDEEIPDFVKTCPRCEERSK